MKKKVFRELYNGNKTITKDKEKVVVTPKDKPNKKVK